MSKQNKQATALLAILVVGFILGLLFAPPSTVTVEKQVEVEKPIEKIVEVESQQCKDIAFNYDIAKKVIAKKNEGIMSISSVLSEWDYYLYNSNALDEKVKDMERITGEINDLERQYK